MANYKNGIKFALEDQNMTEEELAKLLGIDVSVVIGMELGIKRPKPEILVQMCLILKKNADFLMFNERRKPINISKKTPLQKRVLRDLHTELRR